MPVRSAILEKLVASRNLAVERAVEIALLHATPAEQAQLTAVLLERNHRAGWVALIRAFHRLEEPIRQQILSRPRDLFGPLAETMQDGEGPARENVIAIVRQCADVRLVYLLAEALMDARPDVRTMAANSLLDSVRRHWEAAHAPDPASRLPEPEESEQLRRAIETGVRHFKTHRQAAVLQAALIHERQQDASLWAHFHDPYDERTRAATILLRAPAEPGLASAVLLALGSPLKPAAVAGLSSLESLPVASALAANSFRLIDPVLGEPARSVAHLKLLPALRKEPPWNLGNWMSWLRLITSTGLQEPERLNWLMRMLETVPHAPEARAWKMWLARAIADTELPDAGIPLGQLASDEDERVARSAARLMICRRKLDWRERAAEILPKSPHLSVRALVPLLRSSRESLHPGGSRAENMVDPASALPRTHAARGFERTWTEFQRMPPAVQHSTARTVAADPGLAEQLRTKFQGSVQDISQALRMVASLPNIQAYRQQIIALCGHNEPRIVAMAVHLVGRLEDPRLKELLEAAAQHPDARVRANAVESMESLHVADRSQQVLRMLNSRHNRERANAIKALGQFNFGTARDCLARMLGDTNPLHRMSALWVVQQLNLTDVMRQVSSIARRDPNLRVRKRAAEMMESFVGTLTHP